MKFIKNLVRNNKGATAIEYGLIAALIAVAAITAMGTLGDNLNTTFGKISAKMGTAPAAGGATPTPTPTATST